MPLEFAVPASVGPFTEISEGKWVLLIFDPAKPGNSSGWVDFPEPTRHERSYTWRRVYWDSRTGYNLAAPHSTVPEWTTIDVHDVTLTPRGIASLYVAASNITLTGVYPTTEVIAVQDAKPLAYYVPNDFELEASGEYRFMEIFGQAGVVMASSGHVRIIAEDVQTIRSHGVAFGCDGCPQGSDRIERTTTLPTGRIDEKDLWFHAITGDDGTLTFDAVTRFAMVGAPKLDIFVDGHVRLPLASNQQPCDGCIAPVDQTLQASGQILLSDFQATGLQTGSAFVSGDILAARIDETAIDPTLLRGGSTVAVVAAGIGVVALVKGLLIPLFTRLGKQEALEHPKRQRIFQYIQEHPGANFREIARNTTIAAGTVRHHLTVLERAGHVVEHPHQGTVRLFENHGKFDHNWSDLVLLREAPLGKLHEWLKAHPGSPQKAVLEAMEAEGWSRSTTQHRLSRLVEGGLVCIRLQGRLKIYSVVDRSKPPALARHPALAFPVPSAPSP